MLEMEQWRATAPCVQARLATTHVGFHTQNNGGTCFAGRHLCVMILTVTQCHRHVPSGIYYKDLQNDALKAPSVTLKAQLAFALYWLDPCQFLIDR